MTHQRAPSITRRQLIGSVLAAPLVVACRALRGGGPDGAPAGRGTSVADAAVAEQRVGPAARPPAVCVATEDNIEGPFFLPGAPHRAVLVGSSDPGTRLALSGRVLSTRCQPLGGTEIEVWQADSIGRLRSGRLPLPGQARHDRGRHLD